MCWKKCSLTILLDVLKIGIMIGKTKTLIANPTALRWHLKKIYSRNCKFIESPFAIDIEIFLAKELTIMKVEEPNGSYH